MELDDILARRYKEFQDNTGAVAMSRHSRWWAYAIYQGKIVIDGGYATEQEANAFAYAKLPCNFELVCLNTRDRSRATQEIKHILLEKTSDLDFSLRRASHQSIHKEDR